MNKLAIIIAFQYKNGEFLPGAIIDLYIAYKNLYNYKYDVVIYTDITNINNVDDEICNFAKILIPFTGTSTELLNSIRNDCDNVKNIFFYFSGHSDSNSIILPNNDNMSFTDIQNCLKNKRIISVFDCCNCDGLKLPFILENNEFRVAKRDFDCPKSQIIVFTSSNSHGAALTSNTGSYFTIAFFDYLKKLSAPYDEIENKLIKYNRNLQRMCNTLSINTYKGEIVKINLHSSHVIDPVLWNWVERDDPFIIESDISLSCIVMNTE